jgi:1,2-phenylacetyl-CoA epoxidase catalytic subunit
VVVAVVQVRSTRLRSWAEGIPEMHRTVLSARSSFNKVASEYRDLKQALRRVPTEPLRFDASRYSPHAVARAAAVWRERMVTEYRSTTVFSDLASQLMEAGATLDHSAVMLRMAQDELRHAELCAQVTERLGATAEVAYEHRHRPLPRHESVSREECALRNVIYTTCISEMTAVAYFTTSLERDTDPMLRQVTREILSDETLHGRYGFLYLEAWSPWLREHAESRASLTRYLRRAFATAEREFTSEKPSPAQHADEEALGLLERDTVVDLYRSVMEAAVVPGLERFGLDAERAYRERSLEG